MSFITHVGCSSLSLFFPCRSASVALGAFLLSLTLTACISPTKPIPAAGQPESPATETADVTKAGEPTASETTSTSPERPTISLPPIGKSQPESTPMQEEIPVVEAKPVMVMAQRESYTVTHSTTSTKTDTPLLETPMAVQVVPKQVLQDQRVNRLQDALQNVSGVRSNNNDLEGYVFKLRGFTSLDMYRNALRVSGGAIFDTANLERVEVLKGPASTLFGRSEPGGLINLVTKRPLSQPYYKVEQEFGSFDHYRTVVDATGPLNESGSVGYRVTGAYQDHGSFQDFQGGRRMFIAPTFSFKPGKNTDLFVDLQYLRNDAQSSTGIPPLGNRPASLPFHRSFQEPNDPRDWTGNFNFGYELIHRFTGNWSITNRFLYSNVTFKKWNVVATGLDEATGILDRLTQFQKTAETAYSTNIDVKGTFETLGATHRVLIGVDYLHNYYNYNYAEGSGNFPVNIFNPVYGSIPSSAYDDAAQGTGFRLFSSVLTKQIGGYVQDQITLFNRLHVLLGGRYDHAELERGGSDASREGAIADRHTRSGNSDGQFSPRVALLYQFTPSVSGYFNYAKSFGANNGRTASGEPLPPERGVQYELGVKAELLSGLSMTLAAFHLTKQNVLTPDLSTPEPTDFAAIGEARSRGIELDLVGSLTPRLNLIAHYAYLDTKVTRDDSGLQGNRLDNVPSHSGRLFAVYHVGGGEDGLGWRIGGGPTLASKAQSDRENTVELPAFVRLDAFLSYATPLAGKVLTAQLNLYNLLSSKYYTGNDFFFNYAREPRLHQFVAPPFTAIGTVRVEF